MIGISEILDWFVVDCVFDLVFWYCFRWVLGFWCFDFGIGVALVLLL